MREDSISKASPFIPHNFSQYIQHRASMLEEDIDKKKETIAAFRELDRVLKRSSNAPVPPFGGKHMSRETMPSLDHYLRLSTDWMPVSEHVTRENHSMNTSPSFKARGEYLVGKEVSEKL